MLISVLLKSLRDVLRPKILAVMALPFLASFLIWSLVTWFAWDWILDLGFKFYSIGIMQRMIEMLSPYFLVTQDPLMSVTAAVFIVIVIFPAAIVTALLITSALLVPIIVDELRSADFPSIVKKSNSIFTGALTSFSYSIKYLIYWIGSLPFWVAIPFGALFIPFLLLAWFNSRLFAWEVMAEIATNEETKVFVKENSRSLFMLGLFTSFFYYIPLVNFFAPVISSAAFARYCLTRFKG